METRADAIPGSTVDVRFELKCRVIGPRGGTIKLTDDYVKGICNYIPINGRRNSHDIFLSYELGEIILNSRKVSKGRIGLVIELNVTCEKMVGDNIEDIEEIIWTIMPSCYSESEEDIFTFQKAGAESNHCYKLGIEYVPQKQNISYKLNI
jgi:hypothetical protein